ncbi:unnamed protein product [Medioppia subpectinata]|uniref:Uncharacterized protein n=1 Tax=Medioppia subpectinata TaxID=1979941 RepID=A0A7R9LQJ9_9ACAR|nr:unnamed protein product [Medioppia subpectinata]CAG2120844.1 unnamed protein product [Medioppia subpectinata]
MVFLHRKGATTKPLLNYLRIKREVKEEAQLFHLVNAKFIESIVFGVSDITGVHTFNHYWTN